MSVPTIKVALIKVATCAGLRVELKTYSSSEDFVITHFYQSGRRIIHRNSRFETYQDAEKKFFDICTKYGEKYNMQVKVNHAPVFETQIKIEVR
jgi:hypothetical protein